MKKKGKEEDVNTLRKEKVCKKINQKKKVEI